MLLGRKTTIKQQLQGGHSRGMQGPLMQTA